MQQDDFMPQIAFGGNLHGRLEEIRKDFIFAFQEMVFADGELIDEDGDGIDDRVAPLLDSVKMPQVAMTEEFCETASAWALSSFSSMGALMATITGKFLHGTAQLGDTPEFLVIVGQDFSQTIREDGATFHVLGFDAFHDAMQDGVVMCIEALHSPYRVYATHMAEEKVEEADIPQAEIADILEDVAEHAPAGEVDRIRHSAQRARSNDYTPVFLPFEN